MQAPVSKSVEMNAVFALRDALTTAAGALLPGLGVDVEGTRLRVKLDDRDVGSWRPAQVFDPRPHDPLHMFVFEVGDEIRAIHQTIEHAVAYFVEVVLAELQSGFH
jgi:hypothetical protein